MVAENAGMLYISFRLLWLKGVHVDAQGAVPLVSGVKVLWNL